MDLEQQQSRLKMLINHGKEQGFLTYAEVNDYLLDEAAPETDQEQLQIEEIILMLNDLSIPVYEVPPDLETLLSSSGSGEGEDEGSGGASTLASITSELGRTTDPVRMYMREMGTVELLTRQGEIVLAKRIEEGIREVLLALSQYPEIVADILKEYERYERQEARLSDIISGYTDLEEEKEALSLEDPIEGEGELEENDDVDPDVAVVIEEDDEAEGASENSDGEAEIDTGPDPVLAQERFSELRDLYQKFSNSEKKNGPDHKTTLKHKNTLIEAFTKLKLVPRQLDKLNKKMRAMLETVRIHERFIMDLCVNKAKMSRKTFIDTFPKHETDLEWLNKHLKSRKPYVAALKEWDPLESTCRHASLSIL